MKSARLALRARRIRPADLALFDCLLFACRAPGLWVTAVSLRRLAALSGMAKGTVVRCRRRLEAAGLLLTERTRVRVGWASRQGTNRYRFPPPATESKARPTDREHVYNNQLESALRRLGAAINGAAPRVPPAVAPVAPSG